MRTRVYVNGFNLYYGALKGGTAAVPSPGHPATAPLPANLSLSAAHSRGGDTGKRAVVKTEHGSGWTHTTGIAHCASATHADTSRRNPDVD